MHADRPVLRQSGHVLDHVVLPMPRAGDQVLIGMAGAYTTCYSGDSSFNGYPAPSTQIATDHQSSRLANRVAGQSSATEARQIGSKGDPRPP